jgi:ADP-heptose:LPS heptosyltransferase
MAVLIEQILDEIPDSCVIVTHGPWDADAAGRLARYLDGNGDTLRRRVLMVGDLPFGRWAGVLSLCRVVITRDTGSLHLAAALGRPVVAIYDRGSFHHNAQQWAPWMVAHHSLESGQCGETSAEILRRTQALLRESARRAA